MIFREVDHLVPCSWFTRILLLNSLLKSTCLVVPLQILPLLPVGFRQDSMPHASLRASFHRQPRLRAAKLKFAALITDLL
ncbi:MAG: hypothetical protein JWR50_155 [Mucilaginibacter sp.]|nr:hypothetical protein [Mucilaginibacter sp.]